MYNKFCDVVYQVYNLNNNNHYFLNIEKYALDDVESSALTLATLIFKRT